MNDDGNGWEPDPRKMGNWRAMFEQPRAPGSAPGQSASSPPPAASFDDAALEDDGSTPDLVVYRPWTIQRGRSRPALMLGLRRYDPRSGLWRGWGLSYPSLQAVEYLGDKMLSLDFGTRQFVIEGSGLDELARRIEQGSVLSILEYAAPIWPEAPRGPVVTSISRVDTEVVP